MAFQWHMADLDIFFLVFHKFEIRFRDPTMQGGGLQGCGNASYFFILFYFYLHFFYFEVKHVLV